MIRAALVGLLLEGCALVSRGEVRSIRWFSPEPVTPRLTSAPTSAALPNTEQNVALELGRVGSGAHLRERLAYRASAFELGYYDDARWTERPEVYLRREVSRVLYEEHGVRRAVDGDAPVLDLDLEAFEEVRPTGLARVRVRMILHDDRKAILEKTLDVERPIRPMAGSSDTRADAVVRAIAGALQELAEDVATTAEAALPATTKR
jgi:ABC-type uncharacterized transport system auxiliary subunit